jgi:hypothetical protein
VVDGRRLEPYWPCVNGCQTTGSSGESQLSAGVFSVAVSMNSFQIVAGNVPPATAIPCTFSIGISPCG